MLLLKKIDTDKFSLFTGRQTEIRALAAATAATTATTTFTAAVVYNR